MATVSSFLQSGVLEGLRLLAVVVVSVTIGRLLRPLISTTRTASILIVVVIALATATTIVTTATLFARF